METPVYVSTKPVDVVSEEAEQNEELNQADEASRTETVNNEVENNTNIENAKVIAETLPEES